MSDAMIRNNRDAAAYEDRRQHMIANIDNPPRAYTAVDLLPRLGEAVIVYDRANATKTETTLVAITRDGVMLGTPGYNPDWFPYSLDEFNRECRFKNNAEAHHGS